MKKGFEFGDVSIKFGHPATVEKKWQIILGSQSHSSTNKDNKEQDV